MSPHSTLERQVRETLDAVSTAVPIPRLDDVALSRRTRVLRRRRRAGLVAAAAVALVVVGSGVAVPVAMLAAHQAAGRGVDRGTAAEPTTSGLPLVMGGQVQLLQDDGAVVGTGLSGELLGELDGRPVVLDGDRLIGTGDQPISGVARAFVGETGVSYQLADGRVHWSGSTPSDALVPDPGTLLAAGDRGYVVETAAGVVIHDADGDHPVALGSDGAVVRPDSAAVGGGTVVLVADGVDHVFGTDGSPRSSTLGGETGALSPAGDVWAYAPDARERAQGMRAGVAFARTDAAGSSDTPRVGLPQAAIDLTWHDGALFVLTEGGDQRRVWECDRTVGCRVRLISDDETLALR